MISYWFRFDFLLFQTYYHNKKDKERKEKEKKKSTNQTSLKSFGPKIILIILNYNIYIMHLKKAKMLHDRQDRFFQSVQSGSTPHSIFKV